MARSPRKRPGRPAFYARLRPGERREFDRSDAIHAVDLPPDAALGEAADAVVAALAAGRASAVERAGQELLLRLVRAIGRRHRRRLPVPRLRVLRKRPKSSGSELHGLYTSEEDGTSEIRAWMLTAEERRVVLPRTFLRVLLHELCHHLDLELFDLPRTFHTGGFHARESFLLRILERSGARIPRRGKAPPSSSPPPPPPPRPTPELVASPRRRISPSLPIDQLELFATR